MITTLLIALGASIGINLLLFVIAFKLQSDKLTDLSYALSFLSLAVLSLVSTSHHTPYHFVLFGIVALWAIRMGGFLLIRVRHVGKDKRFDELRGNVVSFGRFWLGQALAAWILMLPVLVAQRQTSTLTKLTCLAIIGWALGLSIEAVADFQKFAFKRRPGTSGKWIDEGLWRFSRHPNYFGEMLVWVSIYAYSFSALHGLQKIYCLASPFLIFLLLRFVSGVPILEKSADTRWGKLPAYTAYKRRTFLLIPLPRPARHL